ncbi:MAG: polysaccharide deacetylase family protein [Pseudomonadota bacterium]|nr:polysaccharide deacetylase family protein [Pseudomonadota bacterium]
MEGTYWPQNKRLALSLVVNVEEGSELSIAEGDKGPEPVDELGVVLKKPIRNYGNESNYLYGIKRGAPRIMSLLERYKLRATFTAAARSLELYPDLAKQIVSGGHEVCSHGWRWVHQFHMNEDEESEFIDKAVESIKVSTGQRPCGWLSRYLLTPNTRRLLIEKGFLYHMDDYSDDMPFWDFVEGKAILIIPYAVDSNDMKLWTDPAYTPGQWYEYAKDTFDQLYLEARDSPRMMSLGIHLRIMGRPGRFSWLQRFIEYVSKFDDVWICTRREIYEHWAKQNPSTKNV